MLIFKKADKQAVDNLVRKLGGVSELPFKEETEQQGLISKAIIAVECENSLWKSQKMPDFGATLKPQRRLGGKLGLKKSAVLPTIIIKEEDRKPLSTWQKKQNKKIHIWHVFYDHAYGISFDDAQKLVRKKLIQPTIQTFQAPGGATTKKAIYKFYHLYAYQLAESVEDPQLVPAYVEDKNGHILPYVKFEGGKLRILPQAISILNGITK